ncbi:hypothetical protein [Solitalea koreensis]|uniref:Uncharacterized protein n=1 Tax=Solitalea koreensis TaxID=543615 RepID=A0A521DFL4_9SPHI|nr:hypothetical protein [Solitalea koreensis]SMO69921.1 hypothetical protein SAMN06265350_106229 [Solitalea koreensis]
MNSSLIQKYNVPGPRYTSYTTVPYWENETYTEENGYKQYGNLLIAALMLQASVFIYTCPFAKACIPFVDVINA